MNFCYFEYCFVKITLFPVPNSVSQHHALNRDDVLLTKYNHVLLLTVCDFIGA